MAGVSRTVKSVLGCIHGCALLFHDLIMTGADTCLLKMGLNSI